MSPIRFTWNPEKDRVNRLKHRVSFEEARTVFLDEFATEFFDEDHAKEEERFFAAWNEPEKQAPSRVPLLSRAG